MLATASSRITPEYYQLPVADADAIYRERVYCYELYHQLRCLWEGFPFSLGGEIDKAGHPRFKDGPYTKAKPDLLVHMPGNMDGNLACIEVKPFDRPVSEFTSDLHKLMWFCRHAAYHRGIFLVYGNDPADADSKASLQRKLQRALDGAAEIDLALIHILYHPAALQRLEKVKM